MVLVAGGEVMQVVERAVFHFPGDDEGPGLGESPIIWSVLAFSTLWRNLCD
jgi:hypothetical protein